MTTPNLLTSTEVCDRLGIDRSTLSRWVAAERIRPEMKMPGIRGAFLFDAATLPAPVPAMSSSG